MVANIVTAWIVPAILFVLVLGMGFIGVRWMASQQLASVRSVPLFSGLSNRQLRSVLRSAREVEFPPGTKMVSEGDPGKSFYLIRRGRATVSASGAERAVLEADAYFGELSLLDLGPRTATVTAETQVHSFELTSSAFNRLLENDPAIALAILQRTSQWVRESGDVSPGPEEGVADGSTLAELGRRLRAARHQEWGEPPRRRRRMRSGA
jgi:CRP/FNR family transcriptional regulator, cyclic AMP receptor protein